jgi:16S rRNA C1402 N4-methylase RsmH
MVSARTAAAIAKVLIEQTNVETARRISTALLHAKGNRSFQETILLVHQIITVADIQEKRK